MIQGGWVESLALRIVHGWVGGWVGGWDVPMTMRPKILSVAQTVLGGLGWPGGWVGGAATAAPLPLLLKLPGAGLSALYFEVGGWVGRWVEDQQLVGVLIGVGRKRWVGG